MNGHVYPRIHYPEVYILRGGYCQYYKECAPRCQPSAYVRMDDPQFARDRRGDLDQFRKARFGRTRSYAYGDNSATSRGLEMNDSTSRGQAQRSVAPQRNTVPSGGGGVTSLFAAANAARTRRVGAGADDTPVISGLATLDEDGHTMLASDDSGDCLSGVDCSPCPPPVVKPVAGPAIAMSMLQAKRSSASSGRGPLQRAQTFTQFR